MHSRTCLLVLGSLFLIVSGTRTRADEISQSGNGHNQCIVNPERTPQSDEALSGLVACQVGDDPEPLMDRPVFIPIQYDEFVWTLRLVEPISPAELNAVLTLSTLASFNLLPHP
jgi:hypothetical protein